MLSSRDGAAAPAADWDVGAPYQTARRARQDGTRPRTGDLALAFETPFC
jgi:hypothetical protein